MSKDIRINDTDYTGISTIQVPTTDGNTASFQDIDEIEAPSGSVSITANGTHDVSQYASALVDVPTESSGGVYKYTFTLDNDVELAANTVVRTIAILEEDTSLDVDNNVYSAFIVFGEDITSGLPLFMFTPRILGGIGTNFTTTQSLLILSKGTYAGTRLFVQVYVSNGALILGAYSTTGTQTIPAGTYTAYVVKRD